MPLFIGRFQWWVKFCYERQVIHFQDPNIQYVTKVIIHWHNHGSLTEKKGKEQMFF